MSCAKLSEKATSSSAEPEADVYSVIYDGNSNTGGDVPVDSQDYSESASVTVLGNTGLLVKTNYHFTGWNTAADGGGTSYTPGSNFVVGSSDVILYAQWASNTTTYIKIRSKGFYDFLRSNRF